MAKLSKLDNRTRADQLTRKQRLQLFDRATERQRRREAARKEPVFTADRGWRREDLYKVRSSG